MDSNTATLHFYNSSPLEHNKDQHHHHHHRQHELVMGNDDITNGGIIFDSCSLQKQKKIPKQFIWPHGDDLLVHHTREELSEPLVDLHGVIGGDEVATRQACDIIRSACLKHGFFQVINHGIDNILINQAHDHMDAFFKLPLNQKLKGSKKPGSSWGYSGAHGDRFSSKLPWKETLSFGYNDNTSEPIVLDYFKTILGKDFQETGLIYQRYCKAMKELSLVIMELLAISLGIDRLHFRSFFQDSESIMRCNYYPACQEPSLTFGTGPHCDPTSLTILHQDQVGGLEVFSNNKWYSIPPRPDALVINIGDTFMALTNGIYKSCLHRAVVNKYRERRSLAFFVCPKEDKVVKPPEDLMCREGTRMYPDFTWSALLEFTQKHYRADADAATLQSFTHWLLSTTTTTSTPPRASSPPSSTI